MLFCSVFQQCSFKCYILLQDFWMLWGVSCNLLLLLPFVPDAIAVKKDLISLLWVHSTAMESLQPLTSSTRCFFSLASVSKGLFENFESSFHPHAQGCTRDFMFLNQWETRVVRQNFQPLCILLAQFWYMLLKGFPAGLSSNYSLDNLSISTLLIG